MIRFVKQSSTSGKKSERSLKPSAALGVAGAIQYPLTADDRPPDRPLWIQRRFHDAA